jgi:hypothetical protein
MKSVFKFRTTGYSPEQGEAVVTFAVRLDGSLAARRWLVKSSGSGV